MPLSLQSVIEMDQINEKILRELSRNGRISNLDLAAAVGLSPSACLRRVQELERQGIIAGYRAVIDRSRLGIGFTAYLMVGLALHSRDAQRAFERAVSRAPEVRECHNVTGSVEYILRVEVSDLATFKHFHTEVLGDLPHVRSITSYIVMESPKDERA
ncbi:Lrp/AsnC family transcriptional regulator [Frigidibacter sp. ROC022]|uniref:Lrp/AsnC family transcriptional regulator n=1 Tax=Frigidibacter sp. ROC022 TaxID=2971796 RepID=UPI00215B0AE7|nr:Lrp/AsnC family transcriptional regulator [Frigidibacter sp. ROC022]MCR8725213.1 Lrp/AsnC family transcriptional regulator [Frigidibacter sp. ROC022]